MTSSICHTAIFFLDIIYEKFIDSALSVQISGPESVDLKFFGPTPRRTNRSQDPSLRHHRITKIISHAWSVRSQVSYFFIAPHVAIKIFNFSIISMIFGWVPAVLVAVFPFISQGRVPRTGRNSNRPVRETLMRCLLCLQLQLVISPKRWRNDQFSLDAWNLLVCTLVYHHCRRWLKISPFRVKPISGKAHFGLSPFRNKPISG